jgi:hypothetical protein
MIIYSRQEKGVLHATESLHDFCVTCNIFTSGVIFSEFVSFNFSVEGHAIYTQQAGCLSFLLGSVMEDLKNLMPYDSRIMPDKYSGTPINPAFNQLVASYPACCFRQVLCPRGSRTVEFSF